MKKSLVLALMLVIALSGAVVASDYSTEDTIEFTVNVAPWADIELLAPPELNLERGEVVGESTATGSVTSNIPITISLQSSRFQYAQVELNKWFQFDYTVGATKYQGVELGSKRNTQHIQPGVTNLVVTLRSLLPDEKNWYDLTGDKAHKITVTLTVAAP